MKTQIRLTAICTMPDGSVRLHLVGGQVVDLRRTGECSVAHLVPELPFYKAGTPCEALPHRFEAKDLAWLLGRPADAKVVF